MHPLIESYILATKFEEKYEVVKMYNCGEHTGYKIRMPSLILYGSFIELFKSKDDEYYIYFEMKKPYFNILKRELQLGTDEYCSADGSRNIQHITINNDPESIYSKLQLFEEAHRITTKFYQSTFAC